MTGASRFVVGERVEVASFPASISSWSQFDAAQREQSGAVRIAVLHTGGLCLDVGVTDDVRSRVLSWFARPDLVSVALLDGALDDDPLRLALACDMRLAADDLRVRVGSAVRPGLVDRLVELIGYSSAVAWVLTGREMTSAEAQRVGLVDQVLPVGQLDVAAEALVADLLATPRTTAIELKALLLEASGRVPPRPSLFTAEAQARDRLAFDGAEFDKPAELDKAEFDKAEFDRAAMISEGRDRGR